MRGAVIVMLALTSLCLVGCSATLPAGRVAAFVEEQRASAESAEAAGDLRTALAYWQTIALVSSGDAQVAARIDALEEEIDARVAQALERGRAAYARGDRRAGDRAMLQALALQPGIDEAMGPLRESVSAASHERQAEKVASEFTERAVAEGDRALSKLEDAYAAGDLARVVELGESAALVDSDTAREVTVKAHVGLADQARAAGDPDEELRHLAAAIAMAGSDGAALRARDKALRDNLSKEAYRAGLALMQSDPAGAIAQFERAVSYDSDNLAAREKLDQARRVKANLDRIRGG